MKKLILYILIILPILSISMENSAIAKEKEFATNTRILLANNDPDPVREFVPSYIPKPKTLPGPSVDDQSEKGIRKVFITRILPYVAIATVGTGGGISLLFLIIGGVRFATAYGNEENVTKAKNQVIYAIVGFLISLMAYTIVTAVSRIKVVGDTTQRVEDTEWETPPEQPANNEGNPVPESNLDVEFLPGSEGPENYAGQGGIF